MGETGVTGLIWWLYKLQEIVKFPVYPDRNTHSQIEHVGTDKSNKPNDSLC